MRDARRARALVEVTGEDGAIAKAVIEMSNGYSYARLVAVEAARRVAAGED